jgi:hypothetical protein
MSREKPLPETTPQGLVRAFLRTAPPPASSAPVRPRAPACAAPNRRDALLSPLASPQASTMLETLLGSRAASVRAAQPPPRQRAAPAPAAARCSTRAGASHASRTLPEDAESPGRGEPSGARPRDEVN